MSWLRTTEPSLRSCWLGRQLRELRLGSGVSLRYAEGVTGVPWGQIKAAEQGTHVLQVGRVGALLALYGVGDSATRELLLELARDVRCLHRWEFRADAPPLTEAVLDYLWLESHARHIRSYDPTVVPDLLQLPEYAEAVAQQSTSPVAWQGWACTERQQMLDGPPQMLHTVVAEAALRRPPGRSAAVLRQQLYHLTELTAMPNITVQVLPASVPPLPGVDGSFASFDLGPPYGLVAAVHDLADPVIHELEGAERYAGVFEQLSVAALDEATSAALITEAAKRSSNREE
ncbi:helix-turn-helix domain-containing protein [Phytohabitans houttuyneae]|uniref:Transcriptional regulator n=1 Tax=Phytohabitans houttuyneae TaxID=1076126 RepID=A0A6V8KT46_9ACTN|nr:helix-turn-helix transcriptional regulator [Phytohabitans houttuyneae]GFJ84987.1 transcriptional regulator [Phytohabitans houttuyneae]